MTNHAFKRRGLSLLEVILAISILVASAAVLGQLISIGQMQANKASELTEAQTLCNNKLNELLSGLEPIEAIENQPIAIDSPWDYSVSLEPANTDDLLQITVGVRWHSQVGLQAEVDDNAIIDDSKPDVTMFSLTRWIRTDDYGIDQSLVGFNEAEFMDEEPVLSRF